MSAAMVALATTTLGSSASTITFGSIPATYRDLRVVVNMQTTGDSTTYIRFNGDTGNTVSNVWMAGYPTSSTASSSNTTSGVLAVGAYVNSAGGINTITADILDYATDKHKSVLVRGSNNASEVITTAGRWASTSAITTILLRLDSGASYIAGSTFSLYAVVS